MEIEIIFFHNKSAIQTFCKLISLHIHISKIAKSDNFQMTFFDYLMLI